MKTVPRNSVKFYTGVLVSALAPVSCVTTRLFICISCICISALHICYVCCNYLLQIAWLLQYCAPIFNEMEDIMALSLSLFSETTSIFKGSWSCRDAFALEFWLQGQYHLEKLAYFPKPISWRDTKNNKRIKGMIQNVLHSS